MITTILIAIIAVILTAVFMAALAHRRRRAHFANIGEGTNDNGYRSYLFDVNGATANAAALAAAIAANAGNAGRYLLYKNSTDGDHITVCGAGDIPLGIAQDAYDANNTDQPVNLAILGAAKGTQRVVTDGTIANGNYVKTGATGYATIATTAQAGIFGMAVFGSDTTSAAGDIITVVTGFPAKYAF